MIALWKAMMNEAEFGQLIARIDGGGCPAVLSGLANIHKAHAIAAIRRLTGRPVVVVCSDDIEAKRLGSDVEAFSGDKTHLLFGREYVFYQAESVSRQIEQERLHTLLAMADGTAGVVVATADGLMQRTIPKNVLQSAALTIRIGSPYKMEEITGKLTKCGYSRCDQVEGPGQFAVRGGILDFFSPAHDEPVRCDFFGDELDAMSFFSVSSQRRSEPADAATILPAAEALSSLYQMPGGEGTEGLLQSMQTFLERLHSKKPTNNDLIKLVAADMEKLSQGLTFPAVDKYLELLYPMATGTAYLAEDAVVVLCEPLRIGERAKNYEWQMGEDCTTLLEAGILESSLVQFVEPWDQTSQTLGEFPVIMMDSFTGSSYPLQPRAILHMTAKQIPSYGGSLETAVSDIAHYTGAGYRTAVLCADDRRAAILKDHLEQAGQNAAQDYGLTELPEPGACIITVGALSAGMEYPVSKLAVITEGQFAEVPIRRKERKKTKTSREIVSSYADLSPGDLVVHEQHGIGRYVGIFKIPVDGIEKDYIKIAYAGTDSLYVPATQLDLISKYIGGGEDSHVRLSKMGGAEWARAKTRAKGAARDLAKQLTELYAQRQKIKGHAFAPDSVWQKEFEERFEYEETEDQEKCINEIKRDMERPMPMDRLLCGDVGYGKTEVALRAVMKCVLDGKQAAILVPTTVLAQQHYVTVMKRFAGFPVKIEVFSRFRTAAQIKKGRKELAAGTIDVAIGTHRLLQKDVTFHDLGLLIVDEEQRFGVTHKERLKEIAKQVDVLTLSATPIPRTLNMALSGIRDMSTIEEPPRDRQPVQTYVLEHDWSVLADAMRREVSRGGQVYYLHNRVETIARTAARLSDMLDGINVAVAHGQMDEDSLGEIMEQMAAGEIQVLVCTTIIESGIDIPNVNTLIIEDADRLGLSQLHQIRGRVGRSSRRAFAYLTFRRGKILTEVATKRLSAIREFAAFNSGFKIALRDLEIRGAGNVLGSEQSGHMMSVGYDLYLKLLEEAVLEEKGEKPTRRADCTADIAVTAYIPEKYVPSGEQRMDLYRRIARVRTEEDADDLVGELVDRYGDPPKSVNALVSIALLRGEAAEAGIEEISQRAGYLKLRLTEFEMERISALYSMPEYKGRLKVEAGTVPVVSMKLRSGIGVIEEARKLIMNYRTHI